MHSELNQLDNTIHELNAVESKLNAVGEADEKIKLLRTVPGVGPRLSEAVVAIIDDPHRFKNGRHVSSYLGMVPRRWQSG